MEIGPTMHLANSSTAMHVKQTQDTEQGIARQEEGRKPVLQI